MIPVTRSDSVWSIDDLELELRKLPGVRAAGFEDLDDMLLVQLHVADRVERINRSERTDQPVPVSASRIAARHSDRPVAVEVVRWRTAPAIEPQPAPEPAATVDTSTPEAASPEVAATEPAEPARTRLLAVLAFPDTDELEVHLVHDGKRTIGRAPRAAASTAPSRQRSTPCATSAPVSARASGGPGRSTTTAWPTTTRWSRSRSTASIPAPTRTTDWRRAPASSTRPPGPHSTR